MKFLLLIPIFLFSFNIKEQYLTQNYKDVCLYGVKHFTEVKKDENLLSLIGLSCVKSDYFIYLPPIINYLKHTKEARDNSIYFSILFVEKKLLYGYIMDNTDISYYKLPLINHPLSIVFNNIVNKNFIKENGIIIIKYKNIIYKVYRDNENKLFIDEYTNNQLIARHWYR